VATPRATKRLVNTYRLVKATLSSDDLVQLEGSDHQVVLLLLAIQSGHPDEATEIFRALSETTQGSWWTFVGQWEPEAIQRKSRRFRNQLVDDMDEPAAARWRELHRAALLQRSLLKNDNIGAFRRLWPSVARFGFTTGRVVATDSG
jgi:hypothetical protein